MIRIEQLCLREFALAILEEGTVSELYDWATRFEPDLFVIYDRRTRFSALVISDLVIRTVQQFELPHEERAEAVGLLDVIRRGQMTVRWDQPAARVTRLALLSEREVLIATDDERPRGLFFPSLAFEQLRASIANNRQASESLRTAAQALRNIDELPQFIEAMEREFDERTYFDRTYEGIYTQAAGPEICQNHGWSHPVACPCPNRKHDGTPCGRMSVRR